MQCILQAQDGFLQRIISRASHANKEAKYGIKHIEKLLKIDSNAHIKYSSKESIQPIEVSDHHVHIKTVPREYYPAYSAYLKSQEWRILRKQVLKRDNYKCVDCGIRDGKLSVHHLHYDGIETMRFTTDQLVSVCNRCHDIRHGRV